MRFSLHPLPEDTAQRSRKQTEKGMQYSLDVLSDKRNRLLSKLQRKAEGIRSQMHINLNYRTVSEEFNQYHDLLRMFLDIHQEFHRKLKGREQENDASWFEEIDHDIFTFKHVVHNYLQENGENMSRKSSRSCKSKKTSTSDGSRSCNTRTSMKDQAVQEKIKLADLIAEASFMKEKKMQELAAEELNLKLEIERTRARVKIMEGGEQENEDAVSKGNKGKNFYERVNVSENHLNHFHENYNRVLGSNMADRSHYNMHPEGENRKRSSGNHRRAEVSNTATNMIFDFLRQQGAPEIEIDKFSGNPLEYQYFSSMFKEVVERKIMDPVGRLTRLIKFTDGEAKDLIKHCIHLPSESGYDTAVTLLNKRYGNPHSLLACFRKEIKQLVPVRFGDAMSF